MELKMARTSLKGVIVLADTIMRSLTETSRELAVSHKENLQSSLMLQVIVIRNILDYPWGKECCLARKQRSSKKKTIRSVHSFGSWPASEDLCRLIFIYAIYFVKIQDMIGFVLLVNICEFWPGEHKATMSFDESHITVCLANYSSFRPRLVSLANLGMMYIILNNIYICIMITWNKRIFVTHFQLRLLTCALQISKSIKVI